MTRRKFVLALLIAGAVLLLGNGLARRALPAVPGCRAASRNPFRFRGWPEYIRDVRRSPTNSTVVLITNSQGYAGEYAADRAYPALLERQLNGARVGGRDGWEVLNWSSDGMGFMEYLLLAKYLQACRPTVVLAITGYADYAVEQYNQGFMYCRTDVPRLAARGNIFFGLPRAYLWRHAKLEDLLTCWTLDHVALYRCRDYIWSWLGTAYPGAFSYFYAPHLDYTPWHIATRVRGPSMSLPRTVPDRPAFTYQGASPRMLAEYLDELARVPARVVVVAEPRALNPHDDRLRMDQAFFADLQRLTTARRLPLWDLREALPAKSYITPSHFTGGNHERFADLLQEKIAGLLADTASVPAEANPKR